MRIPIRYAATSVLFGMLAACTQPGDELIRAEQQPAGAPAGCVAGQDCSPATYRYVPPQPVAPAVPDSPVKADCANLPNQVERDTCINRKLSTT